MIKCKGSYLRNFQCICSSFNSHCISKWWIIFLATEPDISQAKFKTCTNENHLNTVKNFFYLKNTINRGTKSEILADDGFQMQIMKEAVLDISLQNISDARSYFTQHLRKLPISVLSTEVEHLALITLAQS